MPRSWQPSTRARTPPCASARPYPHYPDDVDDIVGHSAIEEAMSEAGWNVDAEPVLGDAETSVTARRGDYRARVYTSADQPFFSVKVFGVCQLVTADERDRLRQLGPEPLEPTA